MVLSPASLTKRPVLTGTFNVRARSVREIPAGVVARARAVAEAMFASDEGPPDAERLDWLEVELRGFLGHAGSDTQRVFRACLFAVTVLGPLFSLRVGFAGRSVAERRALLDRVERGPLSVALLGVKAVLCLLYFEHPESAREIGATGGCLVEAKS